MIWYFSLFCVFLTEPSTPPTQDSPVQPDQLIPPTNIPNDPTNPDARPPKTNGVMGNEEANVSNNDKKNNSMCQWVVSNLVHAWIWKESVSCL